MQRWMLLSKSRPATRALASPISHLRLLFSTASNSSQVGKSQEKCMLLGPSPLHRPLYLPLSTNLEFNGTKGLSNWSSRKQMDFKISASGISCGSVFRRSAGCQATGGHDVWSSVSHLLARCYSSLQDPKDRPKG